jgi:uncharacterized membrane protein
MANAVAILRQAAAAEAACGLLQKLKQPKSPPAVGHQGRHPRRIWEQDQQMASENRRLERISGHPTLRVLVSFPIACFAGALGTDIAYARTADMVWADFSAWLLAVGMLFGLLAAVAGIIEIWVNRRQRVRSSVWPFSVGCVLVLVLGLFDNLVHSRDAWTSVVPVGLALSAVTVVAVLITAWFGSVVANRRRAKAQYAGERQ